MKKKQTKDQNFLDFIPIRVEAYSTPVSSVEPETLKQVKKGGYYVAADGIVTILQENTGAMNRIMQKLIHKPRISQIHLEKLGSYIWQQIDGERSVYDIGQLVKAEFGDEAEPLYERLSVYVKMLEANGFVRYRA